MLGMIIFSALISAFLFREMPPVERAFHTVGLAWILQLLLGLAINGAYMFSSEGLVRIGITTLFAAIVFVGAWWSYKRRWTDEY